MWRNKINGQNVVRIFHGFSLVEILVSLSLATFLFFVIAKSYTSMIYNQQKQQELLNLQQHSHQLLNYFQQHIQHIGYQGKDREKSNYNAFLLNGKSYYLASPNCFIFFYDVEGDGKIGEKQRTKKYDMDIFGFNFQNNRFLKLNNKNIKNCRDTLCSEWINSCKQSNQWENILDRVDYQVKDLKFRWVVEDKIISVDIILNSIKYPEITYQATAYSYILNTGE